MISDERAAQLINVIMFSALAAGLVGLEIWITATDFGRVIEIYRSLSFQDKEHVYHFLLGLELLAGSIVYLSMFVRSRLRKTNSTRNASS